MGHFVTVIHLQNNRNTVYTVKPAQVVTSIKKSPVLIGHLFLVLSWKISYELNLF